MRRDEKAGDIRSRDGKPEVVADEAPSGRTRIPGPSTGVLGQSAEVLPRLLGIPRELRDSQIGFDGSRAATRVLVGLKRNVDAEVRPPHVCREDARVVRACLAPVVALNSAPPPPPSTHPPLHLPPT